MKITCEKSILLTSLVTAARAVSTRSTLPAQEGLLLQAEGSVKVSGYNGETGIVSTLSADILETGDIVIPSRMFVDIVRKLPDAMVTLQVDHDHLVHITCEDAAFRIMGLPAEQFPTLPEVDNESTLTLPQSTLKAMLSKTLFAVSVNENKVIHTGALFEMEHQLLNIVTLDGFRLALCREKVDSQLDSIKFVAPGQALREVEHILDEADDKEITIVIGGRHILFKMEGTTVLSRLLDGEFLDYKKAIPSGQPIELIVGTRTLLECVERVSLLVNDKVKNPVRLLCENNYINFSLHTPLGSATDKCSCEGNGEDLEIGFNHRYLIDAMKASLPDETIRIKFGTSLSPCILEPETGDAYLFMVLPVRLKNE